MNKACLTLQVLGRPPGEQRGTPWFWAWWVHWNLCLNKRWSCTSNYQTWCSLSSWRACHCSLWRGRTFCLPSCSVRSEWRRHSLGLRNRTAGTCASWRCSCWPGWCSWSSFCKPPSETRDRRSQLSCQTDGQTSLVTSNNKKLSPSSKYNLSQTTTTTHKQINFKI